jgi:ribose-phosphate pyrophosphokinase
MSSAVSTIKKLPANSVIIAGSNSRKLANNIGQFNDIPVLQHKLTSFINSEMKITIPFNLDPNTNVYVVQSTSNPANRTLVELMLIIDTLRAHGISNIKAIIPYLGYARQDKEHLPGECMSLSMIVRVLQSLGLEEIYTADIHNTEVMEALALPIQNKSTMSTMAKSIYKDLKLNENNEAEYVIASPDQGGVDRAKEFAESFFADPKNSKFVSVKKERELTKAHYSNAVELYGDIDRKKLIIIDDVSTSGGTILNAVELCRANKVEEVYVVIVHADFARGVLEKFENNDLVKKMYTTNTIERPVEDLDWYNKTKMIDISSVFKLD